MHPTFPTAPSSTPPQDINTRINWQPIEVQQVRGAKIENRVKTTSKHKRVEPIVVKSYLACVAESETDMKKCQQGMNQTTQRKTPARDIRVVNSTKGSTKSQHLPSINCQAQDDNRSHRNCQQNGRRTVERRCECDKIPFKKSLEVGINTNFTDAHK